MSIPCLLPLQSVGTNSQHGTSDLEKAVEELSQMLEEPVEPATVKALRQRMVDKTVCHTLYSSLAGR